VYVGVALRVIFSLGWMALFMRWWMRNAFASTPKGVLRHLGRTGSVHLKHVKSMEGVWNPARPLGLDNRVFGAGEATYSLDDSATVTLDFRDRNAKLKRYSGPIPETLIHPTQEALRARKLVRSILVGYVALVVIGFLVGYAVAGGSVPHRLVAGVIGASVVMALAWFITLGLRVGLSVRSLARGKKASN
jgi:hypothetical protein